MKTPLSTIRWFRWHSCDRSKPASRAAISASLLTTRPRLTLINKGLQPEARKEGDVHKMVSLVSAPKSVSLAALLPTGEHPVGDRAVRRVTMRRYSRRSTGPSRHCWRPGLGPRHPQAVADEGALHGDGAVLSHREPQPRSAAPHSCGDRQRNPGRGPSSRLRASPAPCTRRPAGLSSEPPRYGADSTDTPDGINRRRTSASDPCGRTGGALSTGEIMLCITP